MKYGEIAGVDKPVSRLIQGTTVLGGEPETHFELLDAIFEAGCTAFDTAHVYGGGRSERALGRWIAARDVREKVVIVDKGCHHSRERKRVTPEDIAADLADNLDRLETDYVDLWLFHRDDPDVPVGPLVDALNEHLAAGRIRAFGGSNWTHERIAEANAYAEARGLTGFAASSPNLSLAVPREMPWEGCLSISGPDAADARAWYERTQMPLLSWSSLAGGFLTGRYRRDNLDGLTGGADDLIKRCYCTEANFRRLEQAERVAADLGVGVVQVALAWLFSRPLNAFALTACVSGEEFRANLAALDLDLSAGALPD